MNSIFGLKYGIFSSTAVLGVSINCSKLFSYQQTDSTAGTKTKCWEALTIIREPRFKDSSVHCITLQRFIAVHDSGVMMCYITGGFPCTPSALRGAMTYRSIRLLAGSCRPGMMTEAGLPFTYSIEDL